MVIPSNLKAAREVEEHVLSEVARLGYCEASAFAIKLALEEGINNAIRHGNKFDASKTVQVDLDIDDQRIIITITDQGPGFNPDVLPDPRLDENLEKPNGRGVMLMRAYMDEVTYNERGNQVCMMKKRMG